MTASSEIDNQDYIIVRHPDASTSTYPFPSEAESLLKIGRELDNDIVLVDPRTSRYHLQMRRTARGGAELMDTDSANGTILSATRLSANEWIALGPGQAVQIGDSQIMWDRASSMAQTIGMIPINDPVPAVDSPVASAAPKPKESRSPWPWLVGIGGIVIVTLLLVTLLANQFFNTEAVTPLVVDAVVPNGNATSSKQPTPAERAIDAQNQPTPPSTPTTPPNTNQQAQAEPTATPASQATLSPAFPIITLEKAKYLPVISGALFDTNHIYLILQIRIENLGETPFSVSTWQFSLQADTGEIYSEFGQNVDQSEFSRLGVRNRFENLILRAGGSVAEEVVFYLPLVSYENVSLYYQPDDLEQLHLDFGSLDTAQELTTLLGTPTTPALASAGTPASTATQDVAVAVANTPTPTPTTLTNTATLSDTITSTLGETESTDAEPPTPDATILTEANTNTPTPRPTTRPVPTRPAGLTISPASLLGTIAFGDFNGATYDLYFGDVATGKTIFWRGESSQPAFSHRGDRIAYHSWRSDARGLWATTLDQRQGYLIAPFLEDQLPVWGPGDAELILLSRRSGTRQSELFKAPATQERPPGQYLLEGEYPAWHSNDTLVFKGWVTTGMGLQIASGSNVQNYRVLTDNDSDTAPHISPDGQKVIFMSQRQGNWDIYMVNLDGSNLTQLTVDEAQDGLPTWSPDGQVIAFVSNRGGSWAVWAMTSRSRGIRQLFTYQGSPDGFVATEPSNDTTRGWAEERISWTQSVLVPQE